MSAEDRVLGIADTVVVDDVDTRIVEDKNHMHSLWHMDCYL